MSNKINDNSLHLYRCYYQTLLFYWVFDYRLVELQSSLQCVLYFFFYNKFATRKNLDDDYVSDFSTFDDSDTDPNFYPCGHNVKRVQIDMLGQYYYSSNEKVIL